MQQCGQLFRWLLLSACVLWSQLSLAQSDNLLQIHYINVGQGGSTLIIGPNKTRILYDFGAYNGNRDIVPYLRDKIKLNPAEGLHFSMVSHRDKDHYMGYRAVVEAGYDVLVANYDPGSPKIPSATMTRNWLMPAQKTTAGPVRSIPVGLRISLGNGAEAIVMAANGKVYGDPNPIPVRNENDRSISLFIRYGNFHYILDGDLGAGPEACTEHDTHQIDVQTRVAAALVNQDLMDPGLGVDVMHIAHHGSESSTSASYYNGMLPEVGLISVGLKNKKYLHPRSDVVDKVLLNNNRSPCVIAPPLHLLLQTEDGEEGESSTGQTSNVGFSIGNIQLMTDGQHFYEISGDNNVHGGSKEADISMKWRCVLDEIAINSVPDQCELASIH